MRAISGLSKDYLQLNSTPPESCGISMAWSAIAPD
jgi:hypothetical protein